MSDNKKNEQQPAGEQDEKKKSRNPNTFDDIESVENWCFHNTKKLMRKYRSAKMCISATLDDMEQDIEDELGAKMSSMVEFAKYLDIDLNGTYLESRMRSMQQNRMMLGFIDRAVASLRKYDRNGEEFYWILYLKYMAPADNNCINDADIINKLKEMKFSFSPSSFYRRSNAAISCLSSVLWGYTARDTLTFTKLIEKMEENAK